MRNTLSQFHAPTAAHAFICPTLTPVPSIPPSSFPRSFSWRHSSISISPNCWLGFVLLIPSFAVVCHFSYSGLLLFFVWPSLPNCVTTISLSACRLYAAGLHCRIFLCKSLRLQWIIFLMQITGGGTGSRGRQNDSLTVALTATTMAARC